MSDLDPQRVQDRFRAGNLGGAIADARALGAEGSDAAQALAAVDGYLSIAQRHGIDPVHLALAWCRTRPFMASAIFGATTQAQLEVALGSADVTLSAEVLDEIGAVHRAFPMPY